MIIYKNLFLLPVTILTALLYFSNNSYAGADETACNTSAYATTTVEVRDKADGNVITEIPPDATVSLLAAKNGWIKIGDIIYDDYDDFGKKHNHICDKQEHICTADITGWVKAESLGTSVRNYSESIDYWLLSKNSVTGGKAVKFEEPDAQVVLLGCDGSWLKVQYKNNSGWLKPGLNCPNSYTTCP